VEPGSVVLSAIQRLRLSWLFPGLLIAGEGEAHLCTDEHIPIYVSGSTPPPRPLHLDVQLKLWNRAGTQPITVFELKGSEAANQQLTPGQGGFAAYFEEATLEPSGRRVQQYFRLDPPDGEELRAQVGDEVTFRIRASRGRPRSFQIPVVEHDS